MVRYPIRDPIRGPIRSPIQGPRLMDCLNISKRSNVTSEHPRPIQVGNFRTYLKTHSGAKKCHQCEYKSSQAGHLRTHLKMHSEEKPNQCIQCDYASFHTGYLRIHLTTLRNALRNKTRDYVDQSSQTADPRERWARIRLSFFLKRISAAFQLPTQKKCHSLTGTLP